MPKRNPMQYLTVCAAVVTFSSCKPAGTESNLLTLENLAAGKTITKNICHGDPNAPLSNYADLKNIKVGVDVKDPTQKTNLEREVAIAMTSVPKEYVRAMGKNVLDIKIVVTPESDTFCKLGTNGTPELEKRFISACITSLPAGRVPTMPELEGLSIVLASDAGVIRHNLVRTVGQVFAQFFAQRVKARGEKVAFDHIKFQNMQIEAGAAFLEDIVRLPKLFDLSAITPLLGKNVTNEMVLKAVKDFESGKIKNPFTPFKLNPDKLNQFLMYVTTDAFDSYYCRANLADKSAFPAEYVAKAKAGDRAAFQKLKDTRKIAQVFFGATYRKFLPIENYLRTLAAEIVRNSAGASLTDSTSVNASDTAAFGLQSYGPANQGFFGSAWESIKDGAYIVGSGARGIGTGALNVGRGVANATHAAGSGIGQFVGEAAFGDGLGSATSNAASGAAHHIQVAQQHMGQVGDQLGTAHANGDISTSRLVGGILAEGMSNTPIINSLGVGGNAIMSVATERDNLGQGLSQGQQNQIINNQANAAGGAIVQAAVGKAAEAGAAATARGAGALGQRGMTMVAETLEANSGQLSGFGQTVSRGLTTAVIRGEQVARQGGVGGHGMLNVAHNTGAFAHVANDELIIAPSIAAGNGGHGPEH